ncbi:MAG: sugar ABC transporter substrate-binding protein [Chloroflexota bacterium]|nr:MAG: sugar ABC transporter substrate-binding protein [Chloroflexota bacterium]
MNNKRSYFLFSILVVLAMVLTSCANPTTPPTPETIIVTEIVEVVKEVEVQVVETVEVVKEVEVQVTEEPFACEGKKMADASFGSQFAFIAMVDQSMKDAAEEYGVELIFLDNAFDPAKAVENAEILSSRGDIDLVFEFNYYQQQNYVLRDIFAEASLPVVAIDIPIPGTIYYGADNYEAGRQAGLGLAEAAKEKWGSEPVELVLVEAQDLAGQQLLEQRTLGIIAGIKEGLPDLPEDKIVRFPGGVNADEAAEGVATLLESYPDAQRVLVGMLGDTNAVAALNYAESANRDVLASGIGGDEVAISALRTGIPEGFAGTTLFLPENYGYDLIPLGCDILAGKQVAPEVFIKHVFMNANNLTEYYPEE